jgi:RimJ/RimL family protein N-acetyltransferase
MVPQCVLVLPTVPLSDGIVVLRQPQNADAAALYAYGQESDVAQTRWLPLRLGCSRAEARRLVRVFQQGWDSPFGLTLVVTAPPSPNPCGVIHMSLPEPNCGEIGYGIAPAYRGRGLATRAVRLLMGWALAELGLMRLEICVTAQGGHGLASQRVAEKAGFVYEGRRQSVVPATSCSYADPLYVFPALHAPYACCRPTPADCLTNVSHPVVPTCPF